MQKAEKEEEKVHLKRLSKNRTDREQRGHCLRQSVACRPRAERLSS